MGLSRWWLSVALAVALPGWAGSLSPEEVGKAQAAEEKALADVDAAHGNKPDSELSNEERRQIIEEKQKASKAALDKAGVDAKDYARAQATLHGDDRERAARAAELERQRLAKQSAKAGQGAEADAAGPVIIDRSGADEDAAEAARSTASRSRSTSRAKKSKGSRKRDRGGW